MTVLVEWPPGDPGTPPHRHSGPCYGYVTEGAIRFELEGEPERVIKAGETLFEPGGDVIHYQNGNARSDAPSKFVVRPRQGDRRAHRSSAAGAAHHLRRFGDGTGPRRDRRRQEDDPPTAGSAAQDGGLPDGR
ncbi:hypothetical protein GCM10009579_01530 [Streptomyces javensis]|uniref:Cupin type-2 domain-containing protein n=1 Tax=Streptomyces javensis TaxID=114698 RepID=A0ABN1WE91_9ACTN